MTQVLVFLVYMWNKKTHLILPALLLPIIALAWSFGYQPYFEATTTLNVDKRMVSAPLLKNISTPENKDILERRLKNSQLLKDSLTASALIFTDASDIEIASKVATIMKNITFNVIDEESFQITYKDSNRKNAVLFLEHLSENFIDDILAPERLRTEEKLMNLSEQVQYYNEIQKKAEETLNATQLKLATVKNEKQQDAILKEVVRLEFDAQKAAAQKDLAQAEYEKLLLEARSLISGSRQGNGNIVIQYVEIPTIVAGDRGLEDHAYIGWLSLKLGILIGLLSIVITRITDSTLKTDKDINKHLGQKIIGHIPNLGEISMQNGRLIVDPNNTKF